MILRAPNTDRLIAGKVKTYLSAAQAAASGTLTVESIAGYAIGNKLLIGVVGQERSEMLRVHTSTAPTGSTVTLNANTAYRHENGTPLYFVDFDSVEFSRTTTLTGAKTVLTTATIAPDQMDTLYDDLANSTGFGFYRFYTQVSATITSSSTTATVTSAGHGFVTGQSIVISGATQTEYNGTYTITVTSANAFTYTFAGSATTPATGTIVATRYGDYSDAIPYAGYDLDAAATIFDRALSQASQIVSPRLKYEDLFRFLNDFVAFANAKHTRWAEAKVLNAEMDTLATGDWEVTLPTAIARNTDPSAIIGIHVQGYPQLKYVTQDVWNQMTTNLIYTTVATAIAVIDTSIVLTNSYGFADSGTIQIDGDTITYTGNTRSTGTLTGVTGISATHAVDTYALQTPSTGSPCYYTLPDDGKIRMWPVASAVVNNKVIYIDYYRKIPTVNSVGDKILLTNIQPAIDYVAYRIKKHMAGGVMSVADEDFKLFASALADLIENDVGGEPIKVRIR